MKRVGKKPLSWHPKKRYPDAPRWEVLPPSVTPAEGVWWVPFTGMVPATSTRIITSTSPVPFRGTRLSVDPQIAPAFRIMDIRMGNLSLSASKDGVAATLFPPLPDKLTPEERVQYEALLSLSLPTVLPTQRMELVVSSVSPYDVFFDAVLWGIGPL